MAKAKVAGRAGKKHKVTPNTKREPLKKKVAQRRNEKVTCLLHDLQASVGRYMP